METELDYISHHIYISETHSIDLIKIKVTPNKPTYEWIRDESFAIATELGYGTLVAVERMLLLRFLSSLVSFCSKDEVSKVTLFNNEVEYYSFCVINDIKFEKQQWFNTFFIIGTFYFALPIVINISIKLQECLFPTYHKSIDIVELHRTAEEKEERLLLQKYKKNYIDNLKKIQDIGINYLYHFTDLRNVESITNFGILSIDEIHKRGLEVHFSSTQTSREIDYYKKYSNYVHLSYEPDNPMIYIALKEGRLGQYKLYKIDPIVLFLVDTLYSDGNIAANSTSIKGETDFLFNLPFNKFHNKKYYNLNSEDKKLFMSEILVKNIVEKDYILNL